MRGFLIGVMCLFSSAVSAVDLPPGFENSEVLAALESPSGIEFAPDGRLFVAERIEGKLRVAHLDASTDTWVLNPEPFFTFDIPKDDSGAPQRHRSSGLRGFAFDPDFASNGHVYALYMKDQPRHNRVVRITTSATNPDVAADDSELLLFEVPYNDSVSSGSHNGGAVAFGSDGMLYFATGDGWTGGDPVQSLTTMTGKLFRLHPSGAIPTDNPFYDATTGDFRAIYALGLRNPFSMARHPVSGALYINECNGPDKADIFVVAAGANYGHQGTGGGGTPASAWVSAGSAGGKLVTGGAWVPVGGGFPALYHGAYLTPLWGGNNDASGRMNFVHGADDPTVSAFATGVFGSACDPQGDNTKPVTTRFGPDGQLYYLVTNYETGCGAVHRIRWAEASAPEAPVISPPGGWFTDSISVTLASPTSNAEIRFTVDGSEPNSGSTLYSGPIVVSTSGTLRARAFANDVASDIEEATYEILPLRPAESPGSLIAGLKFEYFEGTWAELPNFDALTPADVGTVHNFVLEPRQRDDGFAIRFQGYFEAPVDGVYTFEVQSDDGGELRIGDVVISNSETAPGAGPIGLAAGLHPITVDYFESTGAEFLLVLCTAPGASAQWIQDDSLLRVPNVPPIAIAGVDQVVNVSDIVELNGSQSFDADTDELTLTWQWQQLSGPTVVLQGDDDAVTYFVTQAPGTREFQLSVGDGETVVSDTVTITVVGEPIPSVAFVRGDVNQDGWVHVSDGVTLLSFLFGETALSCAASADVDDSGEVDIGDALSLFSYVFAGGVAPAAPFPLCDAPGAQDLGCSLFLPCD